MANEHEFYVQFNFWVILTSFFFVFFLLSFFLLLLPPHVTVSILAPCSSYRGIRDEGIKGEQMVKGQVCKESSCDLHRRIFIPK